MLIQIILLLLTLIYGYPFGFILGSVILRRILRFINPQNEESMGGVKINVHNEGFWIGMCEHFIVVTLILGNQFTALGLIFAARGIVRSESIRERPSYYLVGMLLSFSMALFFGLTAKIILQLSGNEIYMFLTM